MSVVSPTAVPDGAGERIQDVSGWNQRVARAFAPSDFASPRPDFLGSIRTFEHDGLRVSQVRATGHVLQRSARHLRSSDTRNFVLCLPLEGDGKVVQDERSVDLRPGDATVYDTSRPYTIVHEGPFVCLGVVIPSEALPLRARTMEALVAVHLDRKDPVTALVSETIRTVETGIADLPRFAQRRVAHNIVDLFETLCVHHGSRPGPFGSDQKARQFDEILHYIDDHLDDPDLDPATIAGAHYVSVRALHNLARDYGTSVAGWIRQRRLEMCRDDLADPAFESLGVAAVGARWGFVHAAHFSNLFKTAFGMTPSAYRRSCR